MDINLEKIDILRERTGVSYKEAKEVLQAHNGDLVDSIISIEEKVEKSWVDNMSIAGNEMIEKLKAIVKKGNVSRIILKKDGEILLNIPVTAGAIGAIFAPYVSLFGVATAIATKITIEIVKEDGEIVDINEIADDAFTDVKNFGKKDKSKEEVEDILKKKTDDFDL